MAGKLETERSGADPSAGLPNLVVLVVTLAATTLALAPTFAYLGPKWFETQGHSHGLLIVAITLWLLWRQRSRIGATPSRSSVIAMVGLAVVLFLWSLSHAASMASGVEILWPAATWLAVVALCGPRVGLIVAFPIAFLYFATTIWDAINTTLQETTTAVVSVLLPVLRVPAFIQGNHVQIPSGWFEIAGGCSGLHFFVVALALAALYGHLHYRTWPRRVALVVIAAGMSLVTNWLRVTMIIVAGHWTDMQSYLVQVDHYTFGWVLFGVMLIPFYWIAGRLEEPGETQPAGKPSGVQRWRTPVAPMVGVFALLALSSLTWMRPIPETTMTAIHLPPLIGWDGPLDPRTEWQPQFPGADSVVRAAYVKPDTEIELYANWYAVQTQGEELIGYGNRVEGEWRIRRLGAHKLELGPRETLTVREMIIDSTAGERRLVWYWYQIGDRAEASTIAAKLYGGWRALMGRHGAGLVAVSTVCAAGCDAARGIVRDALVDGADPLLAELKAAAGAAVE